jgi:uncharacterized repeat protein (TIGR02543 family)
MRVAALMGVLGLVLPILTAARASAAPELLLGRGRFGEYQGVRGEDFLAWQQNSRKHPGQYDVLARPITGGDAFKVNAPDTNGANGGIDGDLLVYQQYDRGRSDIKFFDLRTKDRTSPPAGVNTRRWEYWPTMSGQWLLFGRLAGDGSREIILYDLSTRDATKLDEVGRRDTFLEPGQVNGDYAVWSRCTPGTKCNVILYNIVDGLKTRIPNPGGFQYAPSVSSDGTVTFARSASGCGNRVRLLSYPLDGPATVLWRVPSGGDVGTTRVYVNARGDATLYFDNFACGQPAASDVWQILEQGAIQLSVKVEGDGSGSVTSSPAGINCGSDCTETYDSGTGVTLTATPQGGSTFAGWGGACTGTSTTCTLTMDASRSVTATFTNKPSLSVTKTGPGTVTSSPPGINCGNDCNEPYDSGTSVTLTATWDPATATFTGWGGACSGSSMTCPVTMNGSKTVTATFELKPVLTVSVSGGGTVTITPPGSVCDAGTSPCNETYNPNTVVTLTAAPPGSVVWSGACTADPCTVTMDGPKSVTATFS